MDAKHKYYLEIISEAYKSNFDEYYSRCLGRNKKNLLDLSSLIYYVWLESETYFYPFLSPYSVVGEISKRFNGEASFTFPYITPVSYTSYKGFNVKFKTFTVKNHPVIDDLSTYLAFADGAAESDMGEITVKNPERLKTSLTQYNPYYVEYLHNIALELGLVELMPSINATIYKKRKNAMDFFKGDNLFQKILDASVSVCCNKINELFPDDAPFFNRRFVHSILTVPGDTYKLIKFILSDYEIDVDRLLETDSDTNEFTEPEDGMIFSASYFLNTLLTKWFFIPFGFYLNLLCPEYNIDIDVIQQMKFFAMHNEVMDYDQKSALFMVIPSSYHITPFGCNLLKKAKNTPAFEKTIAGISIDDAMKWLIFYNDLDMPVPAFEPEEKKYYINVYDVKAPNKTHLFIMRGTDMLSTFFDYIYTKLKPKNVADYKIYTTEERSPFSLYTSNADPHPHKKTESTYIKEVFTEPNSKIYIDVFRMPNKRYKIKKYNYVAELLDDEFFRLSLSDDFEKDNIEKNKGDK